VARGLNAPLSSSAGRLFDAVAALVGLCPDGQSYEGEAAMRLEALALTSEGRAARAAGDPGYQTGAGAQIGATPLIRGIVDDIDRGAAPGTVAFRFHAGLARAFATRAAALIAADRAAAVALSGGVFQNALLLDLTVAALGYALGEAPILIHKNLPANDGGVALGQALVAGAALQGG